MNEEYSQILLKKEVRDNLIFFSYCLPFPVRPSKVVMT